MGEKPLGWTAGHRTERPHGGDGAWNPETRDDTAVQPGNREDDDAGYPAGSDTRDIPR